MIEDIINSADQKFNGPVEALIKDFDAIRAGRASTASIENVNVDYYGVPTQIKSLANISLAGPRSIQMTPYDKSVTKIIEKELMENPAIDGNISSDGNSVFMNLPELTTEKRQDYVKVAGNKTEEAKVAARAVRHNLHKEIEEFKAQISEDDIKRAQETVDKKLKSISEKINQLFKEKEQQILG
jgi:ribosome recycling factor